MSVQDRILKIFTTSVKALKEFPKYKHFLLSTGLEDDMNYDMNDDSSFSLDSNVAEFTSDAVRLSIMQYLYNYPKLNFNIDLLELEGNIFTFSHGIFHEGLLTSINKHIALNLDFVFPFLPIVGSSHWYTLCISPASSRIIVINPLNQSDQKEAHYLYKVMNILCEKLGVKYHITFENAGIQTSGKSCGESTLLIFFSLLSNSADGYKRLVKHLHKDLPICNIFELDDIVMGRFCKCDKCINENIPFDIIQLHYIGCKRCKGLNINNINNCSYCKLEFNNNNSEKIHYNSSTNRKNMECGIRMGLLNAVEKCDLLDPLKKCTKV